MIVKYLKNKLPAHLSLNVIQLLYRHDEHQLYVLVTILLNLFYTNPF